MASITVLIIRRDGAIGRVNLEEAVEMRVMTVLNYIYYSVYRFVLKTPARSDAEAWAGVFLALTAIIHGLTAYFLFMLGADRSMAAPGPLKIGLVAGMFVLIAVSFWYYVLKGNGPRVIKSFEKHGKDAQYAWAGAAMFLETLLLPLSLSLLFAFWAKLNG